MFLTRHKRHKKAPVLPGLLTDQIGSEVVADGRTKLSTPSQADTKTAWRNGTTADVGPGSGKERATILSGVKSWTDRRAGGATHAAEHAGIDVTEDVHRGVIVGQVLTPDTQLPVVIAITRLSANRRAVTRLCQIVHLSIAGRLEADVATDEPFTGTDRYAIHGSERRLML